MFADPGIRASFFASNTHQLVLIKFLVPDTVVIAGGSLLAATLILVRSRFAIASAWAVVGAVTYAAVGAIAANWPLGSVPIADSSMALLVTNAIACAVMAGRSTP
jgi:hypothetical protein